MRAQLRPPSSRALSSRLSAAPSPRISSQCLPLRRKFHASPLRNDAPSTITFNILETGIFDNLIAAPAAAGLPFAAIIPISALAIRTLLLVPDYYNRLAQQRYLDLSPLLAVWRRRIRVLVQAEHVDSRSAAAIQRDVAKQTHRKQREIISRWRAGWPYRSWGVFTQVPLFVTTLGVWRSVLGPGDAQFWLARWVSGGIAAMQGWFTGVAGAVRELPDVARLQAEGLPWCVDLTAPDPTGALSVALAVVNVVNVLKFSSGRKQAVAAGQDGERKLSPGAQYIRVFLLLLSAGLCPMTIGLPSGVVWYWVSSSTCTLAFHVLWDMLRPLKIPPKPCKKPSQSRELFDRQWEKKLDMAIARGDSFVHNR